MDSLSVLIVVDNWCLCDEFVFFEHFGQANVWFKYGALSLEDTGSEVVKRTFNDGCMLILANFHIVG